MYIKVSDKNKCYRSAFNWTDWFYNLNALETHKDDIICDRTSVIEKLIECFNEQIKSLHITRVLLEKWWFGAKILDEYLKGIFGSNEKYEFAKKMRDQFQKAVCRHPLEWDKTLFNCKKIEDSYFDITHMHLREHVKRKLIKESEKSDIWEGALDKLFKKNDFYFVNPLYFAYHLDRAEVFEFNPYEGKTYRELYGYTELAPGVNMSEVVKDNPGFAPVYDSSFPGRNPNINGYACVTGFFNQDYTTVHSGYTEYWHEGIDFRGNKDTQIKSLIYGQVVDFGTHTGNHNSGKGMGDYMIVQSLKDLNTYYLLVHLAYTSWNTYGIKRGMTITPGMIVAGVGTQEWIAAYHLHVSVIVLEEGEYPIYINERQKTPMIRDKAFRFPVWSNENKNKMRNPFNHKETWKGRL